MKSMYVFVYKYECIDMYIHMYEFTGTYVCIYRHTRRKQGVRNMYLVEGSNHGGSITNIVPERVEYFAEQQVSDWLSHAMDNRTQCPECHQAPIPCICIAQQPMKGQSFCCNFFHDFLYICLSVFASKYVKFAMAAQYISTYMP